MCDYKNEFDNLVSMLPIIVALLAGILTIWQVRVNNKIKNKFLWLNDLQTRMANIIFQSDNLEDAKAIIEVKANLYTIIVKLNDGKQYQRDFKTACEQYLSLIESRDFSMLDSLKKKLIEKANEVFKDEQNKIESFQIF